VNVLAVTAVHLDMRGAHSGQSTKPSFRKKFAGKGPKRVGPISKACLNAEVTLERQSWRPKTVSQRIKGAPAGALFCLRRRKRQPRPPEKEKVEFFTPDRGEDN